MSSPAACRAVRDIYQHWIKRGIDLSILILAAPLFLAAILFTGCLVRLKLGSPIIFRQKRIGFQDRQFELVKFRTMSNECDPLGKLLSEDQRLGAFGIFLRRCSLDELPTLWNALKGEMTLVGPRPLLVDYLPLYNVEQRRRHEVRPGITGWAQVNGRNAISWEQKFALDVWYVDHVSFVLDMKILLLTAWKVLARSDISPTDSQTMTRFEGSATKPPTG